MYDDCWSATAFALFFDRVVDILDAHFVVIASSLSSGLFLSSFSTLFSPNPSLSGLHLSLTIAFHARLRLQFQYSILVARHSLIGTQKTFKSDFHTFRPVLRGSYRSASITSRWAPPRPETVPSTRSCCCREDISAAPPAVTPPLVARIPVYRGLCRHATTPSVRMRLASTSVRDAVFVGSPSAVRRPPPRYPILRSPSRTLAPCFAPPRLCQ
ncbi:hypothetical protein L227DRAFT_572740 [Lentinus tigrinus ALCF2SS1-6]|uniref:Uncharacterized protein n=1 Tax=Lentinus tigrinus ALCF2SS1-6 TaxID=1328759 RepID=A0A5C2SJX8_9APHY|nr:hypothetical protein L227DRAFT_572740 [Lentinus tigrinus ALCF2SS1-6]